MQSQREICSLQQKHAWEYESIPEQLICAVPTLAFGHMTSARGSDVMCVLFL